jgi:hypothetical protein
MAGIESVMRWVMIIRATFGYALIVEGAELTVMQDHRVPALKHCSRQLDLLVFQTVLSRPRDLITMSASS